MTLFYLSGKFIQNNLYYYIFIYWKEINFIIISYQIDTR